jgi:hypothetical protein
VLEEVRRHNDVRLIHVKGLSVHAYLGNDRGRARVVGEGGAAVPASRHGPAANYVYQARTEWRAEEKAAAARAAAALGDAVAAARAMRPLR